MQQIPAGSLRLSAPHPADPKAAWRQLAAVQTVSSTDVKRFTSTWNTCFSFNISLHIGDGLVGLTIGLTPMKISPTTPRRRMVSHSSVLTICGASSLLHGPTSL